LLRLRLRLRFRFRLRLRLEDGRLRVAGEHCGLGQRLGSAQTRIGDERLSLVPEAGGEEAGGAGYLRGDAWRRRFFSRAFALCRTWKGVGWVERSGAHQPRRIMVGLAALDLPYIYIYICQTTLPGESLSEIGLRCF
jgi:hypothetical protein